MNTVKEYQLFGASGTSVTLALLIEVCCEAEGSGKGVGREGNGVDEGWKVLVTPRVGKYNVVARNFDA